MITPSFKILRSDAPDYPLAEREILAQAKAVAATPIRVVVFTNVKDNDEYLVQRERISALCDEIFGSRKPMLALVAQPPLEGRLLAEVTYIEPECRAEYYDDYIVVEHDQLFTRGLYSSLEESIEQQSDDIFLRLGQILHHEGFAIDDIVRQWNYIEHITHISAQGQNYQQFNDSRSHFYGRVEWRNGYPAATGIGASHGGVVVVVDATRQSGQHSRAIDNPLQLSAHSYSQQVLIEGRAQRKTTPKFERARWVEDTSSGMIYVSGTAAIRGEESIGEDAVQQGVMTIENIAHLISTENQLRHAVPTPGERSHEIMRIYVKNRSDWQSVKAWLEQNCTCQQIIPVEADICREELLLEIETIAK